MKALPERKGKLGVFWHGLPLLGCLNESPSGKEGKSHLFLIPVAGGNSLNESPSGKEGKNGAALNKRRGYSGLNESPSGKEGKTPSSLMVWVVSFASMKALPERKGKSRFVVPLVEVIGQPQ